MDSVKVDGHRLQECLRTRPLQDVDNVIYLLIVPLYFQHEKDGKVDKALEFLQATIQALRKFLAFWPWLSYC